MSQKSTRRSAAKGKSADSNRTTFIIVGVIIAAVVVGIVAILLSSGDIAAGPTVDYSEIPSDRAADGGFVLGDPDAPVTIVAFEDFLCPHCQSYEPTIKQFINEYVATGQAKFEYRMLPAVHQTFSPLAAALAECAADNGGSFWEAHDILFELASSRSFNENAARAFAERIDIPYSTLLECQSSATQYLTDQELARELGVTGTPTVLVRVGDGAPQRGVVSQRPSLGELGSIVERYNG